MGKLKELLIVTAALLCTGQVLCAKESDKFTVDEQGNMLETTETVEDSSRPSKHNIMATSLIVHRLMPETKKNYDTSDDFNLVETLKHLDTSPSHGTNRASIENTPDVVEEFTDSLNEAQAEQAAVEQDITTLNKPDIANTEQFHQAETPPHTIAKEESGRKVSTKKHTNFQKDNGKEQISNSHVSKTNVLNGTSNHNNKASLKKSPEKSENDIVDPLQKSEFKTIVPLTKKNVKSLKPGKMDLEKSSLVNKIKKLNERKAVNKMSRTDIISKIPTVDTTGDLRNMLTDSTMKGFFAKNENFTIKKVGNAFKQDEGEKEAESERIVKTNAKKNATLKSQSILKNHKEVSTDVYQSAVQVESSKDVENKTTVRNDIKSVQQSTQIKPLEKASTKIVKLKHVNHTETIRGFQKFMDAVKALNEKTKHQPQHKNSSYTGENNVKIAENNKISTGNKDKSVKNNNTNIGEEKNSIKKNYQNSSKEKSDLILGNATFKLNSDEENASAVLDDVSVPEAGSEINNASTSKNANIAKNLSARQNNNVNNTTNKTKGNAQDKSSAMVKSDDKKEEDNEMFKIVHSLQSFSNKTSSEVESENKLHVANADDLTKLIPPGKGLEKNDPHPASKKENIDLASFHKDGECTTSADCGGSKYCRNYLCYDCHPKNHECVEDDQCCGGTACIYGRCDAKPKGSPGAICDSDADCGGDGCCVIEPTIDEQHGICKRKLQEFHQCSPVLFRKVWVGEHKPKCGPCQDGLTCTEKGIIASHLVCTKDS